MENKVYDVCIIGAGPAGLTSAIYLGRAEKTVALVDKDGFGGNIAKSPKVENIPGFVSVSGADFAANMFEQVSALPTVDHFIEEALLLNYRCGLIYVSLTNNQTILCKSLIMATGTMHNTIDLPTKDIYYCVTCDGPFFKNKNVLVVGSGNTGATYALELATYCKNVYICDLTADPCCEPIMRKKLLENDKIHWLPKTTITAVKNDKDGKLSSVILNNKDTVKINAIFGATGMKANTAIAKQFINKDANGFLITDDTKASTLVPGVFAAGDCRVKDIRQVTTACADGTTAALGAIKFLNQLH